jgi:hypothetical protein
METTRGKKKTRVQISFLTQIDPLGSFTFSFGFALPKPSLVWVRVNQPHDSWVFYC